MRQDFNCKFISMGSEDKKKFSGWFAINVGPILKLLVIYKNERNQKSNNSPEDDIIAEQQETTFIAKLWQLPCSFCEIKIKPTASEKLTKYLSCV